jgi:hypothetical protein
LSRTSKNFDARVQIRHHARLRPDFGGLTDPKMPGHSRLPPNPNEILKHG